LGYTFQGLSTEVLRQTKAIVVDEVTSGRSRVFYGWWIAVASTILHFFAGGILVYGFTVFFNPIRNTFGWTATVTSVAFTLQRLESGFLEIVAGYLVDRVGPRKLMFTGWTIVGLGFILMSRINSLWAFYGSFLIIAIGMSFGAFVVIYSTVAHWFIKKRSRAMTLVATGFGASGILVPLLALSVSHFGWRDTLTFVGIGSWIIGVPLSLLMRHKPSEYGYLPDGEPRTSIYKATNAPNLHSSRKTAEQDSSSSTIGLTAKAAVRTSTFWLLSFVFFFQHMGSSAVMVHIVPYLESVEIPTAIAASAVTGMTLCSLIGRLGFGFLGDFTNKRYLIAIGITLQTIGIFIFSLIDINRIWLIVPFLLTYAPGFGATIPLRPALQADYFGIKNFGTIMGLMMFVSMLGGLASPIVAGWFFDSMESYRLAWRLFALLMVPAIPLMLLVKPPRRKE